MIAMQSGFFLPRKSHVTVTLSARLTATSNTYIMHVRSLMFPFNAHKIHNRIFAFEKRKEKLFFYLNSLGVSFVWCVYLYCCVYTFHKLKPQCLWHFGAFCVLAFIAAAAASSLRCLTYTRRVSHFVTCLFHSKFSLFSCFFYCYANVFVTHFTHRNTITYILLW